MATEPASDLKPRPTELLQNEQLCRLLAENSSDMITRLDLQGRRVYMSPSFERFVGKSSLDAFSGVHPDDLEAAKQSWTDVVAGRARRIRFRHRAAEGTWHMLDG